ncbi:delta(3,5)-delta(2,4)-dienoyl-CoA isomerase, peroxisomal [Tanacetum coccineum]
MLEAVSAIEKCWKVVVAAVHGACIGGGIDIITACDVSLQQVLPELCGVWDAMELGITGESVWRRGGQSDGACFESVVVSFKAQNGQEEKYASLSS